MGNHIAIFPGELRCYVATLLEFPKHLIDYSDYSIVYTIGLICRKVYIKLYIKNG